MHRGTSRPTPETTSMVVVFRRDPPIEIPPRIGVRRKYNRRMDVEKYGPEGTVPSCIVATHSDACRERMERLMMQDPVGADRAARTETRRNEAFARHVEEHGEREKEIARRSTGAQETTSNQPFSSSSSSSRSNGADSNVQHRQESNDAVHKQDTDSMTTEKNKVSRKKRDTSLSAGTEKQKNDADRHSKRQRGSSIATSFQAATRRSFEFLGSCQRW